MVTMGSILKIFNIFRKRTYQEKAFEYLLKNVPEFNHLPEKKRRNELKRYLDYMQKEGMLDENYHKISDSQTT